MSSTAATVAVHKKHPVIALLPGLALTVAITLVAYALRLIPGVDKFSPMILVILIGALIHNTVGNIPGTGEGVTFSLKRILRLAIMLIGLQITAQQAAEVGVHGIAIVAIGLVGTLVATIVMGRLMGI